jgi:hypothetical protein
VSALPKPQPDTPDETVPGAEAGSGPAPEAAEAPEATRAGSPPADAPSADAPPADEESATTVEGVAATVGTVTPEPARPVAARRSRWEKYRPRPAVTLLTFVLGIAIGAGVFVSRIPPPVAAPSLPASPYQSLPGTVTAPLQVIVMMEGLTTTADQLPNVVPDPALGQLKGVVDEFAVISNVEHQGSVIVGTQAVSALIIRGIDHQGRTVASTLTAYTVDGKIVEFR